MKRKSYNLLFRLFSFLSDRTNGAPFFVKYKLILGTLILGLAGTSVKAQKKEMTSDTVPLRKPLPSKMASCYKVVADSMEISQTPDTTNKINDVVVSEKNRTSTDCYAVTKITTEWERKINPANTEPPINITINTGVSEALTGIMCYGIVANPYHNDDIYIPAPKERKFEYYQVTTKPISPIGNLDAFQDWVQSKIRCTEQMRREGTEGEVVIRFTITRKGKLVDKMIIKSLTKEADGEALRVISKSGKWEPGQLYESPVATTMTITVRFNNK